MPEDSKKNNGGVIHISEDVIVELVRKTIQGMPNIKMAAKLSSKFGIGRRGDGIKVSVEAGIMPSLAVDAFVLIKYGQRIPDIAWDVQEKVKDNLERYTGYNVKAVNINVQGIYTENDKIFQNSQIDQIDDEDDNNIISERKTENNNEG